MNRKSVFSLFFTFLILPGCATLFSGPNQVIQVKVIDIDTYDLILGARCVIKDEYGASYLLGFNPGEINVAKNRGVLEVHCRKTGYKQLNTSSGDSFNNTIVTHSPGLLENISGSISPKYPSHYLVTMEKIRGAK